MLRTTWRTFPCPLSSKLLYRHHVQRNLMSSAVDILQGFYLWKYTRAPYGDFCESLQQHQRVKFPANLFCLDLTAVVKSLAYHAQKQATMSQCHNKFMTSRVLSIFKADLLSKSTAPALCPLHLESLLHVVFGLVPESWNTYINSHELQGNRKRINC